jgi:oligopeptide/dipeptide ABC transporter ATP-binding protein
MSLLRIDGLVKDYPLRAGVLGGSSGTVRAVDAVSFSVEEGRTFGLVGESGCGKTTLSHIVLALERPSAGSIEVCGRDPHSLGGRALKQWRRDVQIIAQDPSSALPARMRVGRIVEEPWRVHGIRPAGGRAAAARALLAAVGLLPRHAEAFPHELSGGQRQRVAIARALAIGPRLVVCDEPVSALDVSVQAQILDLLRMQQRERGLGYLFISHDLGVVRSMADEVGVMFAGTLVERGPAEAVLEAPLHPYTRELVAAVPSIRSGGGRWRRSAAAGRAHSAGPGVDGRPADDGCRYRQRCPMAIPRCAAERPLSRQIGAGHLSACHRAEELLAASGRSGGLPA